MVVSLLRNVNRKGRACIDQDLQDRHCQAVGPARVQQTENVNEEAEHGQSTLRTDGRIQGQVGTDRQSSRASDSCRIRSAARSGAEMRRQVAREAAATT